MTSFWNYGAESFQGGYDTRQYTYRNGETIIGAVSKSDWKVIGHTHGQIP